MLKTLKFGVFVGTVQLILNSAHPCLNKCMPQPNSKSRSVLWSELRSGFRCEIEYVEGAVARRTAGEERFSNGDDLVKVSRRRGDKLNDDGSICC